MSTSKLCRQTQDVTLADIFARQGEVCEASKRVVQALVWMDYAGRVKKGIDLLDSVIERESSAVNIKFVAS